MMFPFSFIKEKSWGLLVFKVMDRQNCWMQLAVCISLHKELLKLMEKRQKLKMQNKHWIMELPWFPAIVKTKV